MAWADRDQDPGYVENQPHRNHHQRVDQLHDEQPGASSDVSEVAVGEPFLTRSQAVQRAKHPTESVHPADHRHHTHTPHHDHLVTPLRPPPTPPPDPANTLPP